MNGERGGSFDMHRTFPFACCTDGISVGDDSGDTVDHANYGDAFPFTGTVEKVTVDMSGEAVHDASDVARRLSGRQQAPSSRTGQPGSVRC